MTPAPSSSDQSATATTAGTAGEIVTTQLAVEGMHCGSCSALIEETLAEQAGVSGASVDLEAARAVVSYDPSQVGLDDLRAAITEVGYSATPVG
jgi:copper chaperone CopZ